MDLDIYRILSAQLVLVLHLVLIVMATEMKPTACRASFDLEKDAFLVSRMQDQVLRGKRADSGFKKEAWSAVTSDFNKKFSSSYSSTQLKTRLKMVSCLMNTFADENPH